MNFFRSRVAAVSSTVFLDIGVLDFQNIEFADRGGQRKGFRWACFPPHKALRSSRLRAGKAGVTKCFKLPHTTRTPEAPAARKV